MCATATYTYLPAYKFFGKDVKIIHFIGSSKPWHVHFDEQGEPTGEYEKHGQEHLKLWWSIFCSKVKPSIDLVDPKVKQRTSLGVVENVMESPSGATSGTSDPRPAASDSREAWEQGRPDYTGTAAFDNIMKKMEATMSMSSESGGSPPSQSSGASSSSGEKPT
jgi:glycogenin glucosyltransferase